MNLVKRPYIYPETAVRRNLTRPDQQDVAGILGVNAYPSPDGFLWKQNKVLLGVQNGHPMAAHQNDAHHVELIFARHLNHYNKDKGLWTSLRDHEKTPLEVRLIVELEGREGLFYERRNEVKESMNSGFILLESNQIGNKKYDLSMRMAVQVPLAGSKELEILRLGMYDKNDYQKGFKVTLRNKSKKNAFVSNTLLQS